MGACLLLAVLPSGRLAAQCPDGTPPPCRGAGPARRAAPPLDDKTWIIVPFDNVARVPEIDWLKDASVNLLYLDMSKWRDIRVIDDERVADFIREVPEAQRGLTLQSGIAVARRAGAGKLVMGDLLRVGSHTQLVAKVFDVRNGQRVRTVRQEASSADSIMPAFGQLARGVLDVEPPEGTSLGAIGTTRLDAYQEYLDGVKALNAFDISEARRHFEQAIHLDSTFALAHYKLTIAIGWSNSQDPAHLAHAQAAARLSAALPARERTLIAGQLAQADGDYGHACELYAPLLRADSNDVEALYNFGECSYHDADVVPVPGDSARMMFRGSWNASIRAFQRVLDLDPTYHLAFQHVQDVLVAVARGGCRQNPSSECEGPRYIAALQRAGDSLLTVPVSTMSGDPAVYDGQVAAARAQRARRHNLEAAGAAARRWLEAGPTEPRALYAYGHLLLLSGQVDSADRVLRRVGPGPRSRLEQAQLAGDRAEAALKLGREDEATRLVDSVYRALDTVPGARIQLAAGQPVVGRFRAFDSAIAGYITNPLIARYVNTAARAIAGVAPDSVLAVEASSYSDIMLRMVGPSRAQTLLMPTLAWVDFTARGAHWPTALDTTNDDARLRLVAFVALGDTARTRRALAHYDSTIATTDDEPDLGYSLLSANAHLLLRDSAKALERLRHFRTVTWARTPLTQQLTPSGFAFCGFTWPHTFLLLGRLAEALGQRAEAADAYRRFAGMWQYADPDLQPLVEQARAAAARLAH